MTWGSWGGRMRAAFIVEKSISPTLPMKAGLMWFALIAGSALWTLKYSKLNKSFTALYFQIENIEKLTLYIVSRNMFC